jgi:hypothetical protein
MLSDTVPIKDPVWLHQRSLNVVENIRELLDARGCALFNESNAGAMENPELGSRGSMNINPKVDRAWLGLPGPKPGPVGLLEGHVPSLLYGLNGALGTVVTSPAYPQRNPEAVVLSI